MFCGLWHTRQVASSHSCPWAKRRDSDNCPAAVAALTLRPAPLLPLRRLRFDTHAACSCFTSSLRITVGEKDLRRPFGKPRSRSRTLIRSILEGLQRKRSRRPIRRLAEGSSPRKARFSHLRKREEKAQVRVTIGSDKLIKS